MDFSRKRKASEDPEEPQPSSRPAIPFQPPTSGFTFQSTAPTGFSNPFSSLNTQSQATPTSNSPLSTEDGPLQSRNKRAKIIQPVRPSQRLKSNNSASSGQTTSSPFDPFGNINVPTFSGGPLAPPVATPSSHNDSQSSQNLFANDNAPNFSGGFATSFGVTPTSNNATQAHPSQNAFADTGFPSFSGGFGQSSAQPTNDSTQPQSSQNPSASTIFGTASSSLVPHQTTGSSLDPSSHPYPSTFSGGSTSLFVSAPVTNNNPLFQPGESSFTGQASSDSLANPPSLFANSPKESHQDTSSNQADSSSHDQKTSALSDARNVDNLQQNSGYSIEEGHLQPLGEPAAPAHSDNSPPAAQPVSTDGPRIVSDDVSQSPVQGSDTISDGQRSSLVTSAGGPTQSLEAGHGGTGRAQEPHSQAPAQSTQTVPQDSLTKSSEHESDLDKENIDQRMFSNKSAAAAQTPSSEAIKGLPEQSQDLASGQDVGNDRPRQPVADSNGRPHDRTDSTASQTALPNLQKGASSLGKAKGPASEGTGSTLLSASADTPDHGDVLSEDLSSGRDDAFPRSLHSPAASETQPEASKRPVALADEPSGQDVEGTVPETRPISGSEEPTPEPVEDVPTNHGDNGASHRDSGPNCSFQSQEKTATKSENQRENGGMTASTVAEPNSAMTHVTAHRDFSTTEHETSTPNPSANHHRATSNTSNNETSDATSQPVPPQHIPAPGSPPSSSKPPPPDLSPSNIAGAAPALANHILSVASIADKLSEQYQQLDSGTWTVYPQYVRRRLLQVAATMTDLVEPRFKLTPEAFAHAMSDADRLYARILEDYKVTSGHNVDDAAATAMVRQLCPAAERFAEAAGRRAEARDAETEVSVSDGLHESRPPSEDTDRSNSQGKEAATGPAKRSLDDDLSSQDDSRSPPVMTPSKRPLDDDDNEHGDSDAANDTADAKEDSAHVTAEGGILQGSRLSLKEYLENLSAIQ